MAVVSQDTTKAKECRESDYSYPDILNTFVWNAMLENATDVHLQWVNDRMRILYRVDGLVHPRLSLPEATAKKLINQLKGAAGINAIRSFKPTEGQITWHDNDCKQDIRVTITPVKNRESAHLRFLSLPADEWDMSNLGFCSENQDIVSRTIHTGHGLVLITGGTGSGKTTTLYSLASLMNLEATTTYSIEDPVEFELPYAQQIEVDECHGLTMHEGLRTILRMDPDLILIGEIRDNESAMVAARAALSGKLVLATIHAQDTAGAVDSLHYLGVPHNIIGSSLRLIVAQNLARKLCSACAESYEPDEQERALFTQHGVTCPETLQRATGCTDCNSYGYKRRTGLFEVMTLDDNTRSMISEGTDRQDLSQHLRQQGMKSIIHNGLTKIAEGITSLDEVMRICDLQTVDQLAQTTTS